MARAAPHLDLLLADLALGLRIAPARDVAFALQRFWEAGEGGAPFLEELRGVARLSDEAVSRLEEEADKILAEAGGDPCRALGVRGGIDHTIHCELSRMATSLVGEMVDAGAGARALLKVVADDRYLGFHEIGRGGMGVVYLALDTEMNRRVAMKVVRPDRSVPDGTGPLEMAPPAEDTLASGTFRTLTARFLQEAWVTGGLEHPGIVPVYELGRTEKGVAYYTMRFVKGERTLQRAIEEAESIEDRLALLEPFLKACDTLAYAHSRGVVHRDVKPANVILGEFGEVVVIDWGLARVRERPDLSLPTWKDRIDEIREAEDLKTMAGGLGTPGFMAPEAVLGSPEDVDEKSDVYSLGAILYRSLTGRLPFEFASFPELLARLKVEDPVPPHDVDPAIPEGLSRICMRTLSRDRSERPESVRLLAAAIRAWQRESALDRELEALLHEARTAWEGAEGLSGESLLRQIDRVLGHANRALQMRPGEPAAIALVESATAARSGALSERERASRARLLKRVAVLGLVLAFVTAGVVAWLLDAKRREALAAERQATVQRKRAETEKEAKERALAEVFRLADVKRVRDLVAEADELWPVHPDRAGAMASWIARARGLLAGRADHENALAKVRERAIPYTEQERLLDHAENLSRLERLRRELGEVEDERSALEAEPPEDVEDKLAALLERATPLGASVEEFEARVRERASWRFADPTEAWQHDVLADLVAGLSRLGDGKGAILKAVEDRYELAAGLRVASIDAHREAWERAIAEVAADPVYEGVAIEPILGLVPLGKDPDSGLLEFAHLGSGSVPRRDPEKGRLVYDEDAAIVLVLIPGGSFLMGAQKDDTAGPNHDPQAELDESPVRTVSLRPYLMAKHEVTQAQWAAMTGGERPSDHGAGTVQCGNRITDRNPVEQVSYEDGTRWLSRHRLRLPSEAEWEHSCRAGTSTPWIIGRKVARLGEVANIADAYCKEYGGPAEWPYTEEVNDGHSTHAPAGSFRANAFGLFDMHGNVWEWCEDWYVPYSEARSDGSPRSARGELSNRVLRGGGWLYSARFSRSSFRNSAVPRERHYNLGLRPACRP